MTSAWGLLGTMGRISVWFQGTGYGTSSSSVRILFILVPFFCESMFDDICRSVVHSLPESPFYLKSHLTLSNHLMLGLPLFRTSPSSFFLRGALLCSSYARTSSESYIGLPIAISPTFGASIPYSFIPYLVDLCNFAYPS